jgi:dihydrofolate reductase
MAKLIYSAIASLDGYVADENGEFSFAEPDEAVHTFVNDLERSVGTYLYGRRLYEVMAAWESPEIVADGPEHMRDFAEIWKAADKIVYSTTLTSTTTAKTTIERTFNPESVRKLKASTSSDLLVGGPGLAAHALRAGLVDECLLFVVPTVVGGGTRMFPFNLRMTLDLVDQRRFANGTMFLRYHATT